MADDSDEKAGFIPPEQRPRDSAKMGASEAEVLDRLVAMGRMLLPDGGRFQELVGLVRNGYAVEGAAGVFKGGSYVVPSEEGRRVAAARAAMRARAAAGLPRIDGGEEYGPAAS